MIYRIAFRDSSGYTWGQTNPIDDLGRVMEDAKTLAITYERTAVVQIWEDNGLGGGGWYDYAEKGPLPDGGEA